MRNYLSPQNINLIFFVNIFSIIMLLLQAYNAESFLIMLDSICKIIAIVTTMINKLIKEGTK